MPNQTKTISYLLKITAILIFIFMIWRLWLFVPTQAYEYNLYAAITSAVVGIGVLSFDIIYKLRGQFVGWIFLLCVGMLSIIVGTYFVFFAGIGVPNPLTLPTVAVGQLGFGLIIIIESFLIRSSQVPISNELNRYTIMPILIKITALFAIIWGVYNLVCVIRIFDYYGVTYEMQWQRFLLGIGYLLLGSVQVIYLEYQKRQPHFIMRKIPLLLSFFMLLISFFVFGTFIVAASIFMFPVSIALGVVLLIESYYLVNYPTKIR